MVPGVDEARTPKTPEEIDDRMDLKLRRLERWLNDSPDLYQSVIDREVK